MTDSICEDSSKLSVRGLVKRFDGKETLHNLTFDVREGEFFPSWGLPDAERRRRCASSSDCWSLTKE